MWRAYAILALGIASIITTTLAQDVITVTVHKTCETTTLFPTYSWVMTNGTTSPYTSSSSRLGSSTTTTNAASSSVLPTANTSTGRPSTFTSSSAVLPASSSTAIDTPSSRASSSLPTSSQGSSFSSGSSTTVSERTPPTPYTSDGTSTLTSANPPSSLTTSACATATPASLSCPEANGTLYTPAGGCIGSVDTFVVFCAVEFASGGLVRLEDVESEELCIELCSQDPDCIAVAFDTSDNSCFEKNVVVMGNATANPNLIFAIRAVAYYPPGDSTIWTSPPTSVLPTSVSISTARTTSLVSPSTSGTASLSTSAVVSSTSPSAITSRQSSVLSISSTEPSTTSRPSIISYISSTGSSVTSRQSSIPSFSSTGSSISSPTSSSQPLVSTTSISVSSLVPASSSETTRTMRTISSSSAPLQYTTTVSTREISTTSSASPVRTATESPTSAVSASQSTDANSRVTTSTSKTTSSEITSIPEVVQTSSSTESGYLSSDTSRDTLSASSSISSLEWTTTYGTTTESTTDVAMDSTSAASSLTTSSVVDIAQSTTTDVSSEQFSSESSTSLPGEVTSTSSSAETSESSSTQTTLSETDLPTSTEIESTSSQTPTPELTTSDVASSTVASSTSSSPVPSLCPSANLTTYTNDDVHTYTIYCDMSSPGSYRTVRLDNFVECISACDLDGSCTAVSFSNGICYFSLPPVRLRYSLGSQLAARPGSLQSSSVISTTSTTSVSGGGDNGQPTPTFSPAPCSDGEITTGANDRQYRISCRSDTSGNGGAFEIQNFAGGDFKQCADLCYQRPLCGAWVWGGPGGPGQVGGACYLKEAPQSPTPGTAGMVAGILVSNGGPSQSPSSPSSSTTQGSSATPSVLPEPSACPGGNGTTFYDTAMTRYTIYCGIDSQPSSFNSTTTETFRECIDACSQQSILCGAVGYIGTSCYFKPPPQSFSPEGAVRLAIRALDDGASTSSSISLPSEIPVSTTQTTTSSSSEIETTTTTTTTSTTTTSSSSSSIPDTTTTTTTTTSTSSSSSIPDTTTTTTTTSTSSSSSSAASPSATCIAEDKSTYQTADGADFIVLCNRGFVLSYLPGNPIQLLRPSFEACVEQCAGQGTQCAGATFGNFGGEQQQCYLYSKMLQADDPAYAIVAAVRTSSAEGVENRRQIVENGGFDGALSPWTSGSGNTGNQFTVVDGIATVVVLADDSNTLSQEIPEPAVGNAAYYFFVDVGVYPQAMPRQKRQTPFSPVSCQIDVQNGIGDLFYRQVLGMTGSARTMYGSGTIQQGGVLNIVVNVQCTGTTESVIRLDNIGFFVFQADGGPDPECSDGDVSILQNGGFNTAFAPWTTSQGSSTSASFSVSGGQANVQFAAGASTNADEARIAQPARITTDTSYLITSDLFFTITSGGSCAVNFRNEFESVYTTGQVTTSQELPIRADLVSDIASTEFAITVICSGPGINRVSIDNVGLVLNPGLCGPASTTTSSEMSSTVFTEQTSMSETGSSTVTSTEMTTSSEESVTTTSSEESSTSTSSDESTTSSEESVTSTSSEETSTSTSTDESTTSSEESVTSTSSEETSTSTSTDDSTTTSEESVTTTSSELTTSSEELITSTSSEQVQTSTLSDESSTIPTDEASSSTISEWSSTTTSSGPTSSVTCESSIPGIADTADCPANNGLVFATEDGSEWMLVCNQDYAGSDIGPFSSQTMAECINSCNDIGNSCLGVTYIPGGEQGDNRCFAKYDMNPNGLPGYTVHSAVRMRGPRTGRSPRQLLTNGCFANDLSYWAGMRPGEPEQPINFIWNDGAAYVTLPIDPSASEPEQAGAILSQGISGANTGDMWHLTVQFKTSGYTGDGCHIHFGTDTEPLFSRDYYDWDPIPTIGALYASGTLQGSPSWLAMFYTCESRGEGGGGIPGKRSIDVWASFDDISLTYTPAATEQLLVNNDFDTGDPAPWFAYSYDGYSTFNVIQGRAVTDFLRDRPDQATTAVLGQNIPKTANNGQQVRLQADVYLAMTGTSSSCSVSIFAGAPILFEVLNIDHTEHIAIDQRITMLHGDPAVLIYITCTGTEQVSVALDNVYFTLNPSDEPDPTTLPSESSAMPTSTSEVSETSSSTPTPTSTPLRQIIVNNDFESGSLSPWTTYRYDELSDPGVVENGRAIVKFSRMSAQNWAQANFEQQLRGLEPEDVGKLVRVQADVYIDIEEGETVTCFARMDSVDDMFWRPDATTTSQTYHVDVEIRLQYASAVITVFFGCYGTGSTTTIAVDNLYYYVDVPASIESSTTASMESSTSPPPEDSTSTSTSMSTSSSTSPTPSVRPTVSCPENDGQTYTNGDGSQYIIVCGQDHESGNIVAINPVTSDSFSACVDLCMYQGTACVGVSWFAASSNCFLKSKMMPSMNQNVVVHSAVRISGPALGPPISSLVTNGDFATDLVPWTTYQQTQQGVNFAWNNGKAYIPLSITADWWDFGGSDRASIGQNIAGGTAGQVYFFSMQVNLPSSTATCSINCNTGSDTIWNFDYGMSAQYGAINASGILRNSPTQLYFVIYCSDYSMSGTTVSTEVSFDDVQLSVYNPSIGTNPIRPVRAEGLVNNDFNSGSIDPWTTSSTTGRMTFTIVSGAARITFNQISAQYNSPAYFLQRLNKPSEETQNVRITADVYIYVSDGTTRCTAQVWGGTPVAWSVQDIRTSQAYRVDVSQTLDSGSQWFYLYGNCQGTGTASYVSFDNVYFSMNDF